MRRRKTILIILSICIIFPRPFYLQPQNLQAKNHIYLESPELHSTRKYSDNEQHLLIDTFYNYCETAFSKWIIISRTGTEGYSAKIRLNIDKKSISVKTLLNNTKTTKRIATILPAEREDLLPKVVAEDIFYLWALFQKRPFINITPPNSTIILKMDTLTKLPGFDTSDFDSINISGGHNTFTISFNRFFLTLDPWFNLVPETAFDMILQQKMNIKRSINITNQTPTGGLTIIHAPNHFSLLSPSFESSRQEVIITGSRTPPVEISVIKPLESGRLLASDTKNRLFIIEQDGYNLAVSNTALPVNNFSCFTTHEDLIWIFSRSERRIKIYNTQGRLVDTLRPVFPPSAIPFPQEIAVQSDGSYLVGGSGELWKMNNKGVPLWNINKLAADSREPLPSYFKIAMPQTAPGRFIMADPINKRLIGFSESEGKNLDMQVNISTNKSIKHITGSILYFLEKEMLLPALQYIQYLKAFPGSLETMVLIRKTERKIDKKIADCIAEMAEKLENTGLLKEAEYFLKESVARYRTLRESDPVDPELPPLIESRNNKRKNISRILGTLPDFRLSIPASGAEKQDASTILLQHNRTGGFKVKLNNKNNNQKISDISINYFLQGFRISPSSSGIPSLEGGESSEKFLKIEPETGGPAIKGNRYRQLSVIIEYKKENHSLKNYLTTILYIKTSQAP